MGYSLEAFCKDTHDTIAAGGPIEIRIEKVAEKLSELLKNQDFVNATFDATTPFGKRALYYDPKLDFYVLAHVQEAGKRGTPHSHGDSWAIYGNASAFTRMTEFSRVNPETDDAAVLEKLSTYDIGVGETKAYGPGQIHSTEHPENAWVIRIVGTKLEEIPRFQFRKFRDKIVEAA